MLRQIVDSCRCRSVFFTLALVAVTCWTYSWACYVPQSAASSPVSNASEVAAQRLTLLEAKLAKLETQAGVDKKPQVVAAGTATWNRPGELNNKVATRVKLSGEITAFLGDSCIVLLTTRLNAGGYPYLVPYWKKANDGFDIYLVDSSLGNLTTASYANGHKEYLVDWVVVKK